MSIEEQQASFTEAEICHQAGINATGVSLGFIAHARKHGESAEDAVRWLGAIFAPAWEALRGEGAFAILRLAALNAVSVGYRLRGLSGDEHRAEASFDEWPSQGDLDFFGLTADDGAAMGAAFGPIAEYLGLTYHYERRDGGVVMVMESSAS